MRSYQQRSCQFINTTYSLKIVQLQGNNSNVLDSPKIQIQIQIQMY